MPFQSFNLPSFFNYHPLVYPYYAMAEVTPTVNPPYRDAIARALQSYYTLLTEFPYLPSSAIATPPAEGWGPQHRAVFGRLGKSATVVDVLSHIPYLSTEEFQLNYDTAPLDWRGFRVKQALDLQSGAGAGASAGSGEGGVVSLAQASLEPMLQTIPDNVISLTRPSNYGRWLLLDVDAGTMTDYSVLGGPDPKATDEEREAGAVWRKFETRPIGELFEDWSEKLRSLWWVPLPGPQGESGTIRTPVTVDDADQEVCEAD